MRDDFALFNDDHGDGSPDDADLGLITAYLARELTPAQISAVHDRLDSDATFRERVRPIIEAWVMPASFRAGVSRRVGWLGRTRALAGFGSTTGASRTRSLLRIAAVILAIIVPIVTVAQAARYIMRRPTPAGGAGGNGSQAPSATAEQATPPRGTPLSNVNDGPMESRALRIPASAPVSQPAQARPLGPVVAKSTMTLGAAAELVSLSDGRVVVGDPTRRLVFILDAMLANPKLVMDSAFAEGVGGRLTSLEFIVDGQSKGGRGAPVASQGLRVVGRSGNDDGTAPPKLRGRARNFLVSFRGDSSLWFDGATESFLVIDPAGKIARPMLAPRLIAFTDYQPEWAPFNWGGGIVYKVLPIGMGGLVTPNNRRPTAAEKWPVWKPPTTWSGPDTSFSVERDSLMVVRTRFDSPRVDTLDMLAMGVVNGYRTLNGRVVQTGSHRVVEPLRFVDQVIATSDGYIVTLHVRDYRLEWFAPDGQRTSQKLPHAIRPITSEARRSLIDSLGKLTAGDLDEIDSYLKKWTSDSARLGRAPVNADAPLRPPPEARPSFEERRGQVVDSAVRYLAGSIFPDHYPPVPSQDALRADADGNVWIQQALPGKPDYTEWEVVSRTRGPIDRVRIPRTREIAGFGKGGFVYLIAYEGGVARLEKVRNR
jgi:hypothetical protein